jgi:hypothetical protein
MPINLKFFIKMGVITAVDTPHSSINQGRAAEAGKTLCPEMG